MREQGEKIYPGKYWIRETRYVDGNWNEVGIYQTYEEAHSAQNAAIEYYANRPSDGKPAMRIVECFQVWLVDGIVADLEYP